MLRLFPFRGPIRALKPLIRPKLVRRMYHHIILGIETSCDDTAVAIVNSDREILAEVIKGQNQIHSQTKGIVPLLASEEHQRNIDQAITEVMEQAKMSFSELSAIAVTRGPGLGICLAVGLNTAKRLVLEHSKPLVYVHHMEGHTLAVRQFEKNINFPFLTLLISGGHTLLVVCKGIGDYVQLGTTLDDAAGEAIDKVARMLGLEWDGGGGKAIEKMAEMAETSHALMFDEPMTQYKNCHFSFAGIKAAATRKMESLESFGPLDEQTKANFSDGFQRVVTKHLCTRVARAIEWCQKEIGPSCNTLVVSGGVASNKYIISSLNSLAQEANYRVVAPPKRFCTDNGVMIAWAGMENFLIGKSILTPEEAQPLRYFTSWPLDPSGRNYFPTRPKSLKWIARRTEEENKV